MSQIPDPVPEPPPFATRHPLPPIPVQTIPVQSVTAPPPPRMAAMPPPATPYGYHLTERPARPGVITALGVISIIVAALGMVGALVSFINVMRFTLHAAVAGALGVTTSMPATAPSVATVFPLAQAQTQPSAISNTPVGPRGMQAPERAEVAKGLAELRFLSAPRVEQLDMLLARAGLDIFRDRGDEQLTGERLPDLIEFSGQGLTANPSKPGPDIFRTKAGRFELYDDRAVFFPNRGEIVRVSTLTTSSAGLSLQQVQAVVQQAQARSGNVLNPSQVAALQTLLATPGQQLVSPITVPSAVRGATPQRDGSVVIQFPSGYTTIGPRGQTTTTTTPGGTGAPGNMPMPGVRPRISKSAMSFAMLACLAGAGLAIYLLVVGILVLRQSPRGRKLLLIYALVKIPVTILGVLAAWWLTSSYVDALIAAGRSAEAADLSSTSVEIVEWVLGGFALIFPIALLIVLQARSVKDFYATVLR